MRYVLPVLIAAVAIVALASLPRSDSEAAWPGANGKIVFSPQPQDGIAVVNADGSGRTVLTTEFDLFPTWSPDGSKIAFVRRSGGIGAAGEGGSDMIYTMNYDGGEQTPIGPGDQPSWSPDGTRILYVLDGEIQEMDADGGGNYVPILQEANVNYEWPAYSPDGQHIAFVRNYQAPEEEETLGSAGGNNSTEIYIADADGQNAIQASDNQLQEILSRPSWAPDGSGIVYSSGYDLWYTPYPSINPQLIMEAPAGFQFWNPAYSPDGSLVVFEHVDQQFPAGLSVLGITQYALWVMEPDGNNPHELQDPRYDEYETHPDWGPAFLANPTPSPTPTPPVTPAPGHDTPTPTASPTPTSTLVPTATPTETPAGSTPVMEGLVWGDDNCSEMADPVDALLTLRHDAGLSVNVGDCPPLGTDIEVMSVGAAGVDADQVWGNVDCDTSIVSPIDALKILRYDAALSYSQTGDCPPIGSDVSVQYAP